MKMRFIHTGKRGLPFNPVRLFKTFLAIVCISVSTSMLFSITTPAYGGPIAAFYSKQPQTAPSAVTKGEDQLKDIEKKSEDYLKPENTFSPDKIREESNKGLNEVQGNADLDKMNRPSNSQDADSVENQIERTLGKIQRNT
jgi:hypothetical protein